MTHNDTTSEAQSIREALKERGYDAASPAFYRRLAMSDAVRDGYTWDQIITTLQAQAKTATGPAKTTYQVDILAARNAKHYDSVVAQQHRQAACL
jgi:hypothetical protein